MRADPRSIARLLTEDPDVFAGSRVGVLPRTNKRPACPYCGGRVKPVRGNGFAAVDCCLDCGRCWEPELQEDSYAGLGDQDRFGDYVEVLACVPIPQPIVVRNPYSAEDLEVSYVILSSDNGISQLFTSDQPEEVGATYNPKRGTALLWEPLDNDHDVMRVAEQFGVSTYDELVDHLRAVGETGEPMYESYDRLPDVDEFSGLWACPRCGGEMREEDGRLLGYTTSSVAVCQECGASWEAPRRLNETAYDELEDEDQFIDNDELAIVAGDLATELNESGITPEWLVSQYGNREYLYGHTELCPMLDDPILAECLWEYDPISRSACFELTDEYDGLIEVFWAGESWQIAR